jgi:hypothetical protein
MLVGDQGRSSGDDKKFELLEMTVCWLTIKWICYNQSKLLLGSLKCFESDLSVTLNHPQLSRGDVKLLRTISSVLGLSSRHAH